MTWLITGPTGFLGRHLLQAMQRNAPHVQLAVLLRSRAEWDQLDWVQDLKNVHVVQGSVLQPETWQDDPALANIEGIFHLAALVRHNRRETEEVFHVNVEGTAAMVRLAAQRGCRMVYVSTSGTVGCSRKVSQLAKEDAPFCEREVHGWPYYASKIRAERHATALAKELGVRLVIVRPPMLLGPGDHRYRSTGQVIRFLRGRLPFLLRGGIHYVDIRDASDALVAAMQHANPQAVYHLRGTSCSIDQFFGTLGDIAGRPVPKVHLPYRLAWSIAKADEWLGMRIQGHPLALWPDPVVIEMGTRYWDVDSSHAERDLNFAPRAGRETLVDTVTWLRENRTDCH